MRALLPEYPEVNWVHVEVFTNLDLVPAVTEWGLPSEPWVFVVDSAGLVQGRFEGVVDEAELSALLDRVT